MYILGISCFYHDAAAALIKDGALIAAVEEERISRTKHDGDFPLNAIEFCLRKEGITADDLDYVVFYEKPHLKFERIVSTAVHTTPFSWKVFRDGMLTWLGEKLWTKGLIKDRFSIKDPNRIIFSEHHLSHAASAYYCSPYSESAILTIDGVGEWATATMGTGVGSQINLSHQLEFPHSLGLLYSAFTSFLGFDVNDGEYKVMGMAAFGKPRFLEKIHRLATVSSDGSLQLDMRYFDFHRSSTRMFNHRFVELFGDPRTKQGSEILDPYYSDVAASIQKFTENTLVAMASHLRKTTDIDNLCMAGGVALNSMANYRILREAGFDNIYIQPAASDAGGALGAALWAYHALLDNSRHMVMDHAYYGPEFTDAEIVATLETNGVKYDEAASQDALIDEVVDTMAKGNVIGWYQNKMEWGPRALGNRSILADPRGQDIKDVVNRKIKFREPFRPFAPSVAAGDVGKYFKLTDADQLYPSRFMLYIVPVLDTHREQIPAVTHVDGTARLQVAHSEANPLYHSLISSFGQQTGVPIVLNTSFNLRGEPIVNSPLEALQTFNRSGLDLLVMDRFMVRKIDFNQ